MSWALSLGWPMKPDRESGRSSSSLTGSPSMGLAETMRRDSSLASSFEGSFDKIGTSAPPIQEGQGLLEDLGDILLAQWHREIVLLADLVDGLLGIVLLPPKGDKTLDYLSTA